MLRPLFVHSLASVKMIRSDSMLHSVRSFLCAVLTSDRLINLLGILGYPLAKVDCLRLLRQLQRKDVDAYALTSARLGHEYSKLGKVSRAAVVFAQANTTTV